MLQLRNLSLRRGTRLLLEGADLTIHPGQRVGLVGPNGCGKSSLFALIRGDIHADAGDLSVPATWEIAHVAQQTPSGDQPAIEFVMDGDRELREVQAGIAAAEAADDGLRQAALHARLDAIGGYTAESRAGRLLHGLGFGVGEERRAVDSYSGGWRMRLALGRALMCRSDLLLLDEPTNHLDLDAVIWLEAWLKAYPGTLVLISHDRDFLDAVVTHICHIEQSRTNAYAGNYSAFERQRTERLAQQQASFARQQREIAHMHAFVERFRAKASKARQAQSRIKALERMELIAPAHVDSPFHFAFRPPERLPHPLLRLDRAAAGYGDQAVFQGVGLTLAPGDRIGLLGPNGAGKSTLIKVLAGTLPLLAGRREGAEHLRTGYFAQHQMDQLRPDLSPLRHLQRLEPNATEQELRDYLGGFAFVGDRAMEPVAPLSGGEKARLALALLIRRRPNLLLLDEPTNHLDLDMRQALAEALQGYEGALVLVSHDRHLLRVTSDTLLLVDAGTVTPFDGSIDDYPAWLAARQGADSDSIAGTGAGSAGGSGRESQARKDQRRQDAEQRRRSQPLRSRLQALEARLTVLTARRTELEQGLSATELYEAAAKSRLLALLEEKRLVDEELGQVEGDWLDTGEALEAMQGDGP